MNVSKDGAKIILTWRKDDAEDVAIKVRNIMRELRKETRTVSTLTLFDDALPVIKILKEQGVLLGVISNASRELSRS